MIAGEDSIYATVEKINDLKEHLDNEPKITKTVKDILTKKNKINQYIWHGEDDNLTIHDLIILEIPKVFIDAQEYLIINHSGIIYTKENLRPLLIPEVPPS